MTAGGLQLGPIGYRERDSRDMVDNLWAAYNAVQQRHWSSPYFAAILFYWIRMKVVQQATADLSNIIGRPNGPAYSTGELLNMPLVNTRESLFMYLWGT